MEISGSNYPPKNLFDLFVRARTNGKSANTSDTNKHERLRLEDLSNNVEDAQFSEIVARKPLTKIDILA